MSTSRYPQLTHIVKLAAARAGIRYDRIWANTVRGREYRVKLWGAPGPAVNQFTAQLDLIRAEVGGGLWPRVAAVDTVTGEPDASRDSITVYFTL